jgi:predicted anti-sigma-YlaC factor YlaD
MATRRLANRHSECERARRWASLQLDAPLSELEARWLRSHLRTCDECAQFAGTITVVTQKLRAAEAVLPGRAVALVPRRRRTTLAAAATAAAAAVAVAAGSMAGVLAKHSGSPAVTPSLGGIAATQEPYQEQTFLAMLAHPEPQRGRTVAV